MAHKPESFRLDKKKKQIIIYTNAEQTDNEKNLMQSYILMGYTPKMEEKKAAKTVNQMREELAQDKEALKQFNEIYDSKEKDKGFFGACKFYTQWGKEKKKSAK